MISIGPRLFPARPRHGYARYVPCSSTVTAVADRWFYRSDEEWIAVVEQIKQTPCPHCKAVGTLNRHGTLTGFDDSNPHQPALRARRLFCSNRRRLRPGCGRTFSIWLADKIRRLSITTRTLSTFLQRAVVDTIAAAIRAIDCPRCDRTFQRIWKRFDRAQSAIRTALLGRGPPPNLPAGSARRPAAAQVLAHLQSTFPDTGCPIASFQLATRSFFV